MRLTTASVSAGTGTTCAIDNMGFLWCWGANGFGKLGIGSDDQPKLVPTLIGTAAEVQAGTGHVCAVQSDMSLQCWGSNVKGQLGDTTGGDKAEPMSIAGLAWAVLAPGGSHTCALRSDQSLWCWGDNAYGQLGVATPVSTLEPIATNTGTHWVELSSGLDFTCGIQSGGLRETDGTLWCWGRNTDSQLGDGTTTSRSAPVQIATSFLWRNVTAGESHACAVRKDNGQLFCWGRNANQQLGDGSTTTRSQPLRIGAISDSWSMAAPASTFTCGLKQSGDIWCWGNNASFNKPIDYEEYDPVPKQLWPGTAWKKIHVSASLACGEKQDGTLWCSGVNEYGQVGVGSFEPLITTPTQVGTTPWTEVSIGEYNGCAKNPDGALFCWGYGGWEALGLGTRDARSRSAPTSVP